jgi:hypothetical protein
MGNLSGRLLFQPAQTHREKEIKVNYVILPQMLEDALKEAVAARSSVRQLH